MCANNRCGYVSAAMVIMTLMLPGCAPQALSPSPHVQLAPPSTETPRSSWWYARFRMPWPDDTEPAWSMDLLIAHRIILPVLTTYSEVLPLWRFHRRAVRDQAGHQFSFIFYAPPTVAQQVYATLQTDPIRVHLQQAGQIADTMYDNLENSQRPHIEDTSDRTWASPLQKSWPYFIMGVSQTWLDLIDQYAHDIFDGKEPGAVQSLPEAYQEINTVIQQLWRKEGSHAFLHHLNGIFAYEPLIIHEWRLLQF